MREVWEGEQHQQRARPAVSDGGPARTEPGANPGGCAGLWPVSPAVLGRRSASEPRELSPARSHHRLRLPRGPAEPRGRQRCQDL